MQANLSSILSGDSASASSSGAAADAKGNRDLKEVSQPTSTANDNNFTIQLPPPPQGKNRTIHFLHVGKTGGTTMRNQVLRLNCVLKPENQRQQACKNFKGVPEAALSHCTKGITHFSQLFGTPLARSTDLLFVVRDPIARFFSWFPHLSPHSCLPNDYNRFRQSCDGLKTAIKEPDSFGRKFFFQCFPTVVQMVQALNPVMNGPLQLQLRTDRDRISYQIRNPDKFNVAYTAPENNTALQDQCNQYLLQGFGTPGLKYGHWTAGYRHYAKRGGLHNNNNKPVLVLRTEYLWEDVLALNTALGGSDSELETVRGGQETHGSELYSSQKKSPTELVGAGNLQYLCCALLPDMLAYRDIVKAVNLSPTQKQQTYQITLSQCQVDSWEDLETKCTDHLTSGGEPPAVESSVTFLKRYADPAFDYYPRPPADKKLVP